MPAHGHISKRPNNDLTQAQLGSGESYNAEEKGVKMATGKEAGEKMIDPKSTIQQQQQQPYDPYQLAQKFGMSFIQIVMQWNAILNDQKIGLTYDRTGQLLIHAYIRKLNWETILKSSMPNEYPSFLELQRIDSWRVGADGKKVPGSEIPDVVRDPNLEPGTRVTQPGLEIPIQIHAPGKGQGSIYIEVTLQIPPPSA